MATKRLLEFDFKSYNVDFDAAQPMKLAYDLSRDLATRMAEAYKNNLKIVLLRKKKFATGDTLRSVKDELILRSPSRSLIVSRVTASRSIVNIQQGRKAGLKPPPVSALERWATALGIPKSWLFGIAKNIGRRGIKPVEVQVAAVKESKKAWLQAITTFGSEFSRRLFRQVR